MLAAGYAPGNAACFFTQPWLPLIGGFALGSFTAYMHKFGGRMHWMQSPENMNDSSFAFMLGISVFPSLDFIRRPMAGSSALLIHGLW